MKLKKPLNTKPKKHAKDSVLSFPCTFPVKILGKTDALFETTVIPLIRKHVPDLSEGAVSVRASREGQYSSITVTINAKSQKQLDSIYTDLTKCPLVLLAL